MENKQSIFWFVGYTLFMLMVGANIPTPLYSVYQHTMGFSSGLMTMVFAVYAIVLIPSLLLFGQISDHFGRKKLLIIGLFFSVCGSTVFALSHSLIWLFIARGLQGLAAGMMSGAATAALVELRPQNRKMASLVAALAATGGTAIGPLLGGILAQYGPYPLVMPFIVHLILLIPGIFTFAIMHETVKLDTTKPWRPQWPSVPAQIRIPFIMGAATAFVSFSVAALFMSLVPSFVSTLMGIHNLAMTGGIVFIMLSTSSVTQIIFKNLSLQTSMISGITLLIAGLLGILYAVPAESIFLLLTSTIIAGIGQGLSFMGSLTLVNEIAPANRRGDVVSSLYVVIYLGVGLPVIGIGFGAEFIGLYHAILMYCCFITVVSIFIVAFIAAKMKKWNNSEKIISGQQSKMSVSP